ncbi:MAG TPA: OmpA family protein, partial [Mariniphaga sp.]|nr:OmpA family protein [Mariniphaga sp.]
YYSQKNFNLAEELSLKILSRDSSFLDAHLLLADLYKDSKNVNSEIFHLNAAAKITSKPLIFLRLGNAHLSLGNYEEALEAFSVFLETAESGSNIANEVLRKVESCRFAIDALHNPVSFNPIQLPPTVNSPYDEYWPSLSVDQQQLIFTRLITVPGRQPQEDFYVSEYFTGNNWSKAKPVDEINTPENEGAQSLSADGNILFFTACNRPGGFGSCDIYYSIRRNGKWSIPLNAGSAVNSSYWEAQPSFSSDAKYLYFSSNRPGGKGNRDIWRIESLGFDDNDRLLWGKAVNLGDSINTSGNETSPFIHAGNQDFYFSSDYHIGMGGFDLFVSKLKEDSLFSAPMNLGYPINSHNDEQGLHISADAVTAYFSSKRDSVTGLDIFSFELAESMRPLPATYVKIFLIDEETGEPVQGTVSLTGLRITDEKTRIESTNLMGELLMCIPAGNNYALSVSKEGYLFYSVNFDLRKSRQIYDPYILAIALEPVKAGAEMHLHNIYFETDSFKILPESEPELQTLVHFLSSNPDLKVEIQGHTDNTGNSDKNLVLSERRAFSVVDYLISNGITKERLSWKGYGEQNPVADNETSEGRQQNRRTTIKILEQ